MKLAIMQPYYFPYIGYWQLIRVVDKYVIYDDVNYIKGGWVNRNRILVNGLVQYFSMTLDGASPNKLLNEVKINEDHRWIEKAVKTVDMAYHKAPYYKESFEIIKTALNNEKTVLSEYLGDIIRIMCDFLDIHTEIVISSDIAKNKDLSGQDKVIDICHSTEADTYVNAIGGLSLYSRDAFGNEGIQLKFLKTNTIKYAQFNDSFEPNLSIIDVLMFNGREGTKKLLEEYELI